MMLTSKTSSDLLLLTKRAESWQGAAGSQITSLSDNSDPDEGEREEFGQNQLVKMSTANTKSSAVV
jgi:hypothetical protein